MSLIVPGVLNGSKGPLHYPLEEIGKNHKQWNGIPITLYHPTIGGQNVSAKEPGVLEQSGMGFLRNASVEGKLRAEGCFDEERTKMIHPGVYNSLLKSQPIELSTGLFTTNVPSPGQHGMRHYTHVATQFRADHLAVLPGQRGACSLDDGCGVLVNKAACQCSGRSVAGCSGACQDRSITANCGGVGGKPGPCRAASGGTKIGPIQGDKLPGNRIPLSPESDGYTELRHKANKDSNAALSASVATPGETEGTSKARVASRLAFNGGKLLPGRTNAGRHSTLHEKAYEAHKNASYQHMLEAGKDVVAQPSRSLAHRKAAEAHRQASDSHFRAAQSLKMVGNRMLLANCGGKGGKPGPCPIAKKAHEWHSSQVSKYSGSMKKVHEDALTALDHPSVKVHQKLSKLLPGGSGVVHDPVGGTSTWKKKGGFMDATGKATREKLKAAGFTEGKYSSGGTPDGSSMYGGTHYQHPDGHTVTISTYLGSVASENRHTITLKVHKGNTPATNQETGMRSVTANCGGKGGKPGKCPTGGRAKSKLDTMEPHIDPHDHKHDATAVAAGEKVLGGHGFKEHGGGTGFGYHSDGKTTVYHFDDGSWEHHNAKADANHGSATLSARGKDAATMAKHLGSTIKKPTTNRTLAANCGGKGGTPGKCKVQGSGVVLKRPISGGPMHDAARKAGTRANALSSGAAMEQTISGHHGAARAHDEAAEHYAKGGYKTEALKHSDKAAHHRRQIQAMEGQAGTAK